ncbi:MAG: squalene/phytoene synthase family protein [Candidatus Micrarchaeota archaeon]
MDDSQTCWDILPGVSRSFSLCIKLLPKPLDQQMMVSYLLYRALDTIEDSSASVSKKRLMFRRFLRLLSRRRYDSGATCACRDGMLASLDCTYEQTLLSNLESVMRVFHSQPTGVRRAIRHWGQVMAKGMYEFQKKRIKTFRDQDRYSYYVAGVVGYLFNDLLYHNQIITDDVRRRLRRHARRFGQALQKVNILRDVAHDVPSGRYYWPQALLLKYRLNYDGLCKAENRAAAMKVLRAEIKNALAYLYSGMQYVLALPRDALQVRMFCLIPLFMAIESYIKCIDNHEVFLDEKTVKISRIKVQEIVAKSGLWGTSNEKLVSWFMHSMARADPLLAKSHYSRELMGMRVAPAPSKR